ncbi:hypothetical protein [Flavilitoribacter nigricans]|uniref:HNH endonuclease n=1 Tax=Flavilitoribacter nigricans (strain ATCC 23147 / DSM 23189 / NBRC 102662 / NCIMB 1420 / SS-2) TaxID=1122177 RepID=A0A2D0NHB6_FLAN2|nr:hypothetical protein [Flavilitoribacter nigricans]PHN07818.1 hypothetical protein CRP01_04665 [Flavilitoribacter nigricans DSM 23189 = NBRC 102662]
MMMNFEFPEDQIYFEKLLIETDHPLSILHFTSLFDFRDPALKRKAFSRIRNSVFSTLVEEFGLVCMLQLEGCAAESGFAVDHLIPLSTNKLNKELRTIVPPKGKKVPAQSFGSNHIDNLIIACNKCNGHKKHRLLERAQLLSILRAKNMI